MIVLAANAAVVGFFALAWPLLREPQVVAGGALFAALAACWLVPPTRSA